MGPVARALMVPVYVGADGLFIDSMLYGPWVDPHEEWCNTVRDALMLRRWEDAYRMLEKHDDDELARAPRDRELYTLPLIELADRATYDRVRVRFCKLGVGVHPLLAPRERWYHLSPFVAGSVAEVFAWEKRILQFLGIPYEEIKAFTVSTTKGRPRRSPFEQKRSLASRRR